MCVRVHLSSVQLSSFVLHAVRSRHQRGSGFVETDVPLLLIPAERKAIDRLTITDLPFAQYPGKITMTTIRWGIT